MNNSEDDGVRLLVFDGGDIRCLSQLDLLEEFLYQVQWKRRAFLKTEEPILPCNYFHVIGGVGPAGFIVILLVVFRMPIQEVKDEFVKIWKIIFADKSSTPSQRHSLLNEALRSLFERKGVEWEQRLRQSSASEPCKGFICAVSNITPSICQKFRSYNGPERSVDITLNEAILCCWTSHIQLEAIKIGPPGQQQEYISGIRFFNNPIREAIRELHGIYVPHRRIACIISLGYGKSEIFQASDLYETGGKEPCARPDLQIEQAAEEMDTHLGSSQVYYRFSVDRGLESSKSISLDNLGVIEARTRAYLQQAGTRRTLAAAVVAAERTSHFTTKDICCAQATRRIGSHSGLPPLCSSFVMRKDLFDSMTKAVFHSDGHSRHIMVLSGMGGIGKTQMVLKFARVFSSRFHYILFVNGGTIETIRAGLTSAVRIHDPTCKTFEDALGFLAHPDRVDDPSLLILDNVDDPNINLSTVLPRCDHGFIIVTTRNPTQGDISPQFHIKVGVMAENEALEVFLLSAFISPTDISEEYRKYGLAIIKELGNLPVAIVQAGSFIKQRRCITDYLKYLKSNRQKVLSTPAKAQLDDHCHAIYATLNVTLAVFTPSAKKLLGLLACFDYTDFPLALIERAAHRKFQFQPYDLLERTEEFYDISKFLGDLFYSDGAWSKIEFEEVLLELEQYSLVMQAESESTKSLRFHPLVHAWMFDTITAQSPKQYRDAALRLLVCGTAEEDEDIYEEIIKHIKSVTSSLAHVHVNDLGGLAKLMLWEGRAEGAMMIWSQIKRIVVGIHGERHLRTTRVTLQLARACFHANRWEAVSLFEEVITFRKEKLSPGHLETLEALTYMAEVDRYVTIGPGPGGLSLQGHREVVEALQRNSINAPRPLIFKAMEILARMCQKRQLWEEAERLLNTLLKWKEEYLGTNHKATLSARGSLALLQLQKKDKDSSNSRSGSTILMEPSLDIIRLFKVVQGPLVPDVLRVQDAIANIYEKQARYEDSVALRKEIAEVLKMRKGFQDSTTHQAIRQFADLLVKLNRYEEAAIQWEQIISALKSMVVFDKQEMLQAMVSRANILEDAKRYNEAAIQWQQIISSDLIIRQDSRLAPFLISFMRVCTELGRYKPAAAEVLRWLQTYESWLVGEFRVLVFHGVAILLEKAEHYKEAAFQWERAIKNHLIDPYSDSRSLILAISSLTKICLKLEGPSTTILYQRFFIEQCDPRISPCVFHKRYEASRKGETVAGAIKGLGFHQEASKLFEHLASSRSGVNLPDAQWVMEYHSAEARNILGNTRTEDVEIDQWDVRATFKLASSPRGCPLVNVRIRGPHARRRRA